MLAGGEVIEGERVRYPGEKQPQLPVLVGVFVGVAGTSGEGSGEKAQSQPECEACESERTRLLTGTLSVSVQTVDAMFAEEMSV